MCSYDFYTTMLNSRQNHLQSPTTCENYRPCNHGVMKLKASNIDLCSDCRINKYNICNHCSQTSLFKVFYFGSTVVAALLHLKLPISQAPCSDIQKVKCMYYVYVNTNENEYVASYPGASKSKKIAPGIYCTRMREISVYFAV